MGRVLTAGLISASPFLFRVKYNPIINTAASISTQMNMNKGTTMYVCRFSLARRWVVLVLRFTAQLKDLFPGLYTTEVAEHGMSLWSYRFVDGNELPHTPHTTKIRC
jgi:hypothetical protein